MRNRRTVLPGVALLGALLMAACVAPTRPVESLPPRQPVAGASDRYELVPAAAGWYRVPAGTVGDAESDLELRLEGGAARVVVYVEPGGDETLDALVGRRRSQIAYGAHIEALKEKRFFLAGSDHVAASLARYTRPLATRRSEIYWVMTVRTETETIEAIGVTNTSADDERAIYELLSTLRMR